MEKMDLQTRMEILDRMVEPEMAVLNNTYRVAIEKMSRVQLHAERVTKYGCLIIKGANNEKITRCTGCADDNLEPPYCERLTELKNELLNGANG